MKNEESIILALLLLFTVAAGLTDFVNGSSRKLRYINHEIGHTEGAVHHDRRRRRRRLCFSLLPFGNTEPMRKSHESKSN